MSSHTELVRRRPWRLIAALCLALTLVAYACGDSDDDSASGSETTAAGDTETTEAGDTATTEAGTDDDRGRHGHHGRRRRRRRVP